MWSGHLTPAPDEPGHDALVVEDQRAEHVAVNGEAVSITITNGHSSSQSDLDHVVAAKQSTDSPAGAGMSVLSLHENAVADLSPAELGDFVVSSVGASPSANVGAQPDAVPPDALMERREAEQSHGSRVDAEVPTGAVELKKDLATCVTTEIAMDVVAENTTGKATDLAADNTMMAVSVQETHQETVQQTTEMTLDGTTEQTTEVTVEDAKDTTAGLLVTEPVATTVTPLDPTTDVTETPLLVSETEASAASNNVDPLPATIPPPTPTEVESQSSRREDIEMADAPASQGKNAREREDDSEDGPATKRTRTADDGPDRVIETAEFKVPELPKPSDPGPPAEENSAPPGLPEEQKGITKLQHKFLLSGLRNLKRTKDAPPFSVPVDPIRLNIPSYPDVVKHPMDLGTLEEKLKGESYTTVEDYVADFNLILNNTLTFNGPEHTVTKQAMNLKAIFDRQMSNLPKADVLGTPPPEKKKAKKPAAPKVTPARRQSRSSIGAARSPTNTATSPTTFALGPSGTPLIRRDSTVGDGRPKREIHPPPPRDLPYSTSKPKKKKFLWELKFCQEALNEMLKPKYFQVANPFYNPVDPVALNIPHYHKIVKKPMDLATIGSKLKNGEYENAKEFEVDVRLMFNNCYRFNPPNDPIHHMGKQLEHFFNEKWAQKKQWINDHAPGSGRQSPSTSPEPDEDEDDEEDEEEEEEDEQSEIKILQKQIEAMSKQVELIQKKKSTPPAAGKKKTKGAKAEKKRGKKKSLSVSATSPATTKPDKKKKKKASTKKERTPYITYEQKQEISNRINTLPPSRMSTALKIIRDNMPNLKVCCSSRQDFNPGLTFCS